MDIAGLLILFLVGIFCFALRAIPRVGKPFVGHDAWAILLVVDQLKKGEGYNGVSRFFLLGGDHDYPPLFFYLLSLFPSSWLRKYNSLINPFLDAVNASILVSVGYFLTGDIVPGAIAGVIYSFTPVVLEESLIFSTRVFGMILFNSTLLSYVLYQSSGNSLFILLTGVGGILVLVSHKFAAEVLFLLLLSFAFVGGSFLPAAIFLSIFLGALLFSGGFYLKVLRGQLGINMFWLRHHSDYGASYLGKQGSVEKNVQTQRLKGTEDGPALFVKRLWNKTKRANPFYWLLSLNPFNPFALVVLLVPFVGIENAWEWIFLEWSVLTLIFYYAAAHLRFMGHYAGRYQFLDYNAFATAMLCSIFVWKSFSYLRAIVIAIALLLALIQNIRSWTRVRKGNRSDDQSLLEDIFDYLRKSPKDGVICLPASHTYAVPYFTGKRVFYTMSARNYEKIAAFFPILTVPLASLSEEYGIDFVIIDKILVPVDALDLAGFKPVMERNDFLLLEKGP